MAVERDIKKDGYTIRVIRSKGYSRTAVVVEFEDGRSYIQFVPEDFAIYAMGGSYEKVVESRIASIDAWAQEHVEEHRLWYHLEKTRRGSSKKTGRSNFGYS